MGEFRITPMQKSLLLEALGAERLEVGKYYNADQRRAAEQMVKMHWLTYTGTGWHGRRFYRITDLGRTVARQLGLSERST